MREFTFTGKQKEVMAYPATGHIIVLGTAGSGKTTMALLRAKTLVSMPANNKVLLITFNRALVKYMKKISSYTEPGLVIEHYHKFARGYLNSLGKMPAQNGILGDELKIKFVETAVANIKSQHPNESTLKRSTQFFLDEIAFIQRFGFSNDEEYFDTNRIGRASANIRRDNRKWTYMVFEEYKALRENAGAMYDWDDIACYVYNELVNDVGERKYAHIIIDEGQDFSPMMIKSLVNAVKKGGSFTFFGDVAQQIYGNRLSWRDSGVNVEKVLRLEVNYRNPQTITAFANDITKSKYWQHNEDMVTATNQIAEGPKPILVQFKNKESEMGWVVHRAETESLKSSTVIVCRSNADIAFFEELLKKRKCKTTKIDEKTPGYTSEKTVYLATFHAVKGLEFENVFIPFLSVDKFPNANAVANTVSDDDAYANELKLLYVAATRSKYGLYMTFSQTLSPLFPERANSYDAYSEEDLI